MKNSIGIRELKNHLSQILKEVSEKGQEIDITNHGQVIARLVPVKPVNDSAASGAAWARLKDLSNQIGERWTGGGATDAINEIRRDL
jgi:prevent-host-death family protein